MNTNSQWIIAATILAIGLAFLVNGATETAMVDEDGVPPLRLANLRCFTKHGYMNAIGEVVNKSDKPISNLLAVGVWRTDAGTFVTSANALVEYQPLMPGQSSPYRVMAIANPVASRCEIAFRTMFGGQVAAEF